MAYLTCRICGDPKDEDEFSPRQDSPTGRRSECRDCHAAQARDYYASHREQIKTAKRAKRQAQPVHVRAVERRSRFKRHYGLSFEEYDWLLVRQEGSCAICQTQIPVGPGKRFVVDHNSATGQVRGLLCSRCNTALGLFQDDIARLQAAIRYLRRTAKEN
jgi:hypothetical protein